MIFFFLALLSFAYIYQAGIEAVRLKNDGRIANGVVKKYELEKRNLVGKVFLRHMHQIHFETFKRGFELDRKFEEGSKIPVLFLPENPNVSIAGHNRSFIAILSRDYRWVGLAVAACSLLFFSFATLREVISFIM